MESVRMPQDSIGLSPMNDNDFDYSQASRTQSEMSLVNEIAAYWQESSAEQAVFDAVAAVDMSVHTTAQEEIYTALAHIDQPAPTTPEPASSTMEYAAQVSFDGTPANVAINGTPLAAGGIPLGGPLPIDPVLASGYNPACCPGYFPGYVSSYRRQGKACMPQCPPGFRFSALWDACVPIAPSICHAAPCTAPVMGGCSCAKQYPTHHRQGYGSVANCYYPGANSSCAPGYTRVGDKCVWTKW